MQKISFSYFTVELVDQPEAPRLRARHKQVETTSQVTTQNHRRLVKKCSDRIVHIYIYCDNTYKNNCQNKKKYVRNQSTIALLEGKLLNTNENILNI